MISFHRYYIFSFYRENFRSGSNFSLFLKFMNIVKYFIMPLIVITVSKAQIHPFWWTSVIISCFWGGIFVLVFLLPIYRLVVFCNLFSSLWFSCSSFFNSGYSYYSPFNWSLRSSLIPIFPILFFYTFYTSWLQISLSSFSSTYSSVHWIYLRMLLDSRLVP